MSVWQEVVTAALLGTARQPFKLPASGDSLGEVLAGLSTADQESALLSAAAAISCYQRVGQLPALDTQPPLPICQAEDRPRCCPRAIQHLQLMLNKQHAHLLPEWLAALDSAGRRIPEDRLPAILELGRAQPALREAILPVLGQHGRWLAAFNPAWAYALPGDDDVSWQTGGSGARLLLLRRLRAHAPQQALQLLASTWKEESPQDRAAFLAAFEIGLSMEDEPFLEEALNDRRKEVRSTAADWLLRLPQSRLCQRMIERVRPLVSLEGSPAPAIVVNLPDECDKAMKRDGIEPKPPSGKGEKAWWLGQIVAAVPPDFWQSRSGQPPSAWLQAAEKCEWEASLLVGWAGAAQRTGHVAWLEAILDHLMGARRHINLVDVFSALPPERKEARIAILLLHNARSLDPSHPVGEFLVTCRHPWRQAFSQAVLDSLCQCIADAEPFKHMWPWPGFLGGLAVHFDPALTAQAAERLAETAREGKVWAVTVDNFLGVLQFRRDMLDAVRE